MFRTKNQLNLKVTLSVTLREKISKQPKDKRVNPIIKKFQYGNQTVTLETGRIARQATGAVLVTVDEVTVLCTVVGSKEAKAGQDFFPLSVHYQEKSYAAGRIPGGYLKREGRPSEKET